MRLVRLAAAIHHAVHAQVLEGVRLGNLPAARTAHDHLETRAVRAVLERLKQFPRVVRIDRFLRGAENRSVHAGGKRNSQRIVRRNTDDPRARPNELRQIVGITADHIFRGKLPQQGSFHQSHAGRHVAGGAILVTLHLPPLRILLVDHAFHLLRHRCQSHLDKVAGVVDRLRQRSGEHDQFAFNGRTVLNHRSNTSEAAGLGLALKV